MTNPQNVDLAEATRTPRFVKFLRAAVAVKTKPVTEVNKYNPVIWFSRLPTGLDEIRSPLPTENWPSDDMRWLVVKRVGELGRTRVSDSEWNMAIREVAANTLRVGRITDQIKGRMEAAAALASWGRRGDDRGATE